MKPYLTFKRCQSRRRNGCDYFGTSSFSHSWFVSSLAVWSYFEFFLPILFFSTVCLFTESAPGLIQSISRDVVCYVSYAVRYWVYFLNVLLLPCTNVKSQNYWLQKDSSKPYTFFQFSWFYHGMCLSSLDLFPPFASNLCLLFKISTYSCHILLKYIVFTKKALFFPVSSFFPVCFMYTFFSSTFSSSP